MKNKEGIIEKFICKIDKYRTKRWYNLNGELHREDGPAIELANGSKFWYVNGKRHREDGPAVECTNGYKEWYLNGKYHRENGPAVEWADGYKEWYRHGEVYDPTEHEIKLYESGNMK